MAVKIKLKRLGKIRAPYYRIVIADSRTKRDGRAIEEIGKYHPKSEPSFIEVNSERAQHWLSVGAQPTDPVRKILEITGDWQKFKGLPGAEGTLRTAEPKADRKVAFAAAVAETLTESGAKAKPKGKADTGKAEKAPAKADARRHAKADTAKAEKAPARAKKADEAKAPAADTVSAETPAEVAAEADAEATAGAKAEAIAEVAADSAPEGSPAAEAAPADTAPAETAPADVSAEADAEATAEAKAEAIAEVAADSAPEDDAEGSGA